MGKKITGFVGFLIIVMVALNIINALPIGEESLKKLPLGLPGFEVRALAPAEVPGSGDQPVFRVQVFDRLTREPLPNALIEATIYQTPDSAVFAAASGFRAEDDSAFDYARTRTEFLTTDENGQAILTANQWDQAVFRAQAEGYHQQLTSDVVANGPIGVNIMAIPVGYEPEPEIGAFVSPTGYEATGSGQAATVTDDLRAMAGGYISCQLRRQGISISPDNVVSVRDGPIINGPIQVNVILRSGSDCQSSNPSIVARDRDYTSDPRPSKVVTVRMPDGATKDFVTVDECANLVIPKKVKQPPTPTPVKQPGRIEITKKGIADNALFTPKDSFEFRLVELGLMARTNSEGKAVFENIPAGTYHIEEVNIPSGWAFFDPKDGSLKATVTKSETPKATFINQRRQQKPTQPP